MTRKKEIDIGLKNLPHIPHREELKWLAGFVDEKKDNLYSMIFGYHMVNLILRVLILVKSQDRKKANNRGLNELIKIFKQLYPEEEEIINDLHTWKEKRDVVTHSLFFDNRINGKDQLEKFIHKTQKEGAFVHDKLVMLYKRDFTA